MLINVPHFQVSFLENILLKKASTYWWKRVVRKGEAAPLFGSVKTNPACDVVIGGCSQGVKSVSLQPMGMADPLLEVLALTPLDSLTPRRVRNQSNNAGPSIG